jgi:lipoprotein-anchoring transpeptidase ErfK/SrfK
VRTRGALIGAVAAVLALASACTSTPAPVGSSSSPPAIVAQLQPAVADTTASSKPVLGPGTWVAVSKTVHVDVWRGPGTGYGKKWVYDTRNPVGQRLAFLVTDTARDDRGGAWLEVLVAIRPNGAHGWVRRSEVRVKRSHDLIVVDLSGRTLRRFHDGALAQAVSVGIGRPQTPTATGTFFVWAHVPQASASGPYGVFALGLSGFSEILTDWPGGGRMAIHGTADPADRGQMVSHGCVRVFNPDMLDLGRVPLGTPVIIRR